MKEITITDCEQLRTEFEKYLETAEQHEFVKLFVIDTKFSRTLAAYKQKGIVINQEDANAMFRVVLGAMGKDFSIYTKE